MKPPKWLSSVIFSKQQWCIAQRMNENQRLCMIYTFRTFVIYYNCIIFFYFNRWVDEEEEELSYKRQAQLRAGAAFGSGSWLKVCYHLNTGCNRQWNFYFTNSRHDSFTDVINRWQSWRQLCANSRTSPGDPRCSSKLHSSQQAFFFFFPFFFIGERNKHRGLAASSPLRLAIRHELHFSLGSSLDLVITAEARQHLDSDCRPRTEPELLPPIWVGVDKVTGVTSNPNTRWTPNRGFLFFFFFFKPS